jgi:hypothetical protein
VVFDTSRETFPELTGKQWYRTVGFKQLAVVHGALDSSYRRTAEMLNRVRHQLQATPVSSLRDAVEAEGQAAAAALDSEARRVLDQADIAVDTLVARNHEPSEPTVLAPELIEAACSGCRRQPCEARARRTTRGSKSRGSPVARAL